MQTTAPLLASVCSGESPAPHNPQPRPTLNLFLYFCRSSSSVHFSPTSLLISFFPLCLYDFLFFSNFSLSSCFAQSFLFISQCFPIHTSPHSFYFAITHPPVRSIYLCVAESLSSHRTPLYMPLLWSLLLLLCLLSCHSPALHL